MKTENQKIAEKAIELMENAETKEEALNAIEWHESINDPDIDIEYDGEMVSYLDLWGESFGEKNRRWDLEDE